jgi:4-amino-4-deoxy-L-arabinose transferase-like glycosyltransferase
VSDPRRPPVRPLDPPLTPFALAGTTGWAVAGLVLLVTDAPADWRWACLAGVLLGLALLAVAVRHDRRHRRR